MRVLATERRIAPFGDLLSEIPLLGRSFAELRADEAHASGVEVARLTWGAHAFATASVLRAFAQRAPRGRPSRLTLPHHALSRALAPASSIDRRDARLSYDIFLDAPEGAGLDQLRSEAQRVDLDVDGVSYRRELPRIGPGPHHLDLPADGFVAAHVEHWVHLLWLAPLLVPAGLARAPKVRRRRPSRVPSLIGEGAQIHPTAHVEGSIVGEGAQIAAGCSLRHSFVGARSRLAEHTKLDRCVLGDRTLTLADANFSHVVSLGEGTLTNLLLKDVLIGRAVFLTSGVIFWGERDGGGTVTVDRDGQEIDTERRFVGGCVGHGSVLGARTIVAAGRALPNRTMVVMRREEGVLRIERQPPGTPLCWDNAALVPFDHLEPGRPPDELRDRRGVPP